MINKQNIGLEHTWASKTIPNRMAMGPVPDPRWGIHSLGDENGNLLPARSLTGEKPAPSAEAGRGRSLAPTTNTRSALKKQAKTCPTWIFSTQPQTITPDASLSSLVAGHCSSVSLLEFPMLLESLTRCFFPMLLSECLLPNASS